MKKFDLAAVLVIIAAGLALAGVLFAGSRLPVEVICRYPAGCAETGPYGALEFEFSRPVQPELVESLWKTEPPSDGSWEWIDDRRAVWHSARPLPSGSLIEFTFQAGRAGANGESIRREFRWRAVLRRPEVIATHEIQEGQELYAFDMDGQTPPRRITNTKGQVYNYKASPDGEQIALTLVNVEKGMDLWFINRDGSDLRMGLNCGVDRCMTPTWSPDMKEIIYTRQNAGLEPDGPPGAPRTYILDLSTGQTAPLIDDSQVIGFDAAWSPDGKWLSIWNGAKGGIQIVNRESSEGFLVESFSGNLGSWSPDSRSLYFANTIIGESSYRSVVFRADIDTRTIDTILGGNLSGQGASYENPVVNPADGSLAVAVQPNVRIPGRRLQVLDPESGKGVQITSDLSVIPSFYSWTPDGSRLVYQLDYLQGKTYDVEIWQWERASGASTLVARGERWPQWLP